jgi:hypothetical protein
MHKEPNGTLVMTTCKCRENTKNLVMTRTYFNEMLENKIAWGAEQERKRIIELLNAEIVRVSNPMLVDREYLDGLEIAVDLIKGATNE